MSSLDAVNLRLCGLTTVLRLTIERDAWNHACDATLELADRFPSPRRVVRPRLSAVQGLLVDGHGGPALEMSCLQVSDARREQHDGIRYAIEELENGTFRCRCWDFALEDVQPE